jgi:hypothetical protein
MTTYDLNYIKKIDSREIITTYDNYNYVRPIKGTIKDALLLSYQSIKPLVLAYKVVALYGKYKNRIFTGGMAIDLALKAKNSYIYKGFDIDFDFFSPEFHKDAYELAYILAKNKDKSHLNAIVASHPSTMRVRYNWQPLADITFIPDNIYENIPTMGFNGYRIVHPCYQMIDQHISLSQPYANEPLINLMGRYPKDFIRYLKLAYYYNVEESINEICKVKGGKGDKNDKSDAKYEVINEKDIPAGTCLSGSAALYYWTEGKYKKPINENIILYSDEYEATALMLSKKLGKPIKYYRRVLDKLPKRAEVGNYEIYDNRNRWIAAKKVNKHHVAGIHTIGVYLLTKAMLYKNILCGNDYIILHDFYIKSILNKDPIALLADVYGKYKLSETRILQMIKLCAQFKNIKPINNTPKNYYMGDKPDIKFDPSKSPLYEYDGVEDVKKLDNVEDVKKLDNVELKEFVSSMSSKKIEMQVGEEVCHNFIDEDTMYL